MIKAYFFDTYALIETFEGNRDYAAYEDVDIILTKLNIFELCCYLYKRGLNMNEVDEALLEYMGSIVDYGYEVIKGSAEMKMQNRRLSMTDCIGYQIAQEHGVKFLTGDREFEGMANVEFIK